jgi:hypothetical protein
MSDLLISPALKLRGEHMNDKVIPHKLQKFLGDQYTEINKAAVFEEPGRIIFDDSGNRPKLTLSIVTGQFIEGFGEWYAQKKLSTVFGDENVLCEEDGTTCSAGNRTFVFSLYGKLQDLLSKVEEWEHAGIDPSEDNNAQLQKLLKKIAEEKVSNQNIHTFMGGMISDESAVVEFFPGIPYTGDDVMPEELEDLRSHLAQTFLLERGISFYLDDKAGVFTQLIVKLDHISSLDLLRRASRNGIRLEKSDEETVPVEEYQPNGI